MSKGALIERHPADLAALHNHWWWRPGMRVGRRVYACHLNTFERSLWTHVAHYQHSLAAWPTLDLIPLPWLHMTMQGIGFTDEVGDTDVEQFAEAATARLHDIQPFTLTFDRPMLYEEAITLQPTAGGEQVRAVRDAIRAGIVDVWGSQRLPEPDARFRPHVSIAYVNADEDPDRVAASIADTPALPTATITIDRASLIALHRDDRIYQWREVASLPLGT